ncbi:hypothetical protein ES703_65785 [subsurface metagenome]
MKKAYIPGIAILLVMSLLMWAVGPVMAQDEEFQRIDKPLSPVGGDDVYSIPPGSTIHHLDNGITKVYGPDGRHVLTTRDTLESLIPVPMGGLVGASHVHSVPSGSKISRVENGIKVYHDGACILSVVNEGDNAETPPPSSSGWIEYSRDSDVDDLRYFRASWSVTAEPPDHDYWTTDYIFNAIVSPDGTDILQPVLEWNVVRGTYEWTCAAWYGIDDEYFHGARIDASVDDDLYGYMRKYDTEWKTKIRNLDTGESSILWTDPNEFHTGDNLKIFCALEGWYVDDDDDVPGDTLFHDMIFTDDEGDPINITWYGYTPGTAWGLTDLKVVRYSDEEVELQTAN